MANASLLSFYPGSIPPSPVSLYMQVVRCKCYVHPDKRNAKREVRTMDISALITGGGGGFEPIKTTSKNHRMGLNISSTNETSM
jgi:hypothetical protein